MGFIPLALLAAANAGVPAGQQLFTASGTFVVPEGVKSISVVCVGGGGGGEVGGNVGEVNSGGGGALACWSLRSRYYRDAHMCQLRLQIKSSYCDAHSQC